MALLKVSDQSFDKVIQSNKLVLVDFYADWCGPCRIIAPVLHELDQEFDDQLMIAKLNVDENPMTSAKQEIMSIPTIKFFKNGKMVAMTIGLQPKEELRNIIRNYM